jgi:ribonuclease VapC
VIVIDTSALMSIIKGEPEATACLDVIEKEAQLLIAAPNLYEALIVAAGRQLHGEMANLIHELFLSVQTLTEERTYAAVRSYRQWGKGFHPAALNFGDCFAYALAKEQNCPLLFVGNDFSQTDIRVALG